MISSQVIKLINIDQQGSHNAILQVAITVLLSIAAVSPTAQAQQGPQAGDWLRANEQVHEAGGWKAYARESQAGSQAKSQAAQTGDVSAEKMLSLAGAIEIALNREPSLVQTLSTIRDKAIPYLQLSGHQREALTAYARISAQTEELYHAAVAAGERLAYREQVSEAASLAAELAARMRKVGNLNALHTLEEKLSFANAQNRVVQAQLELSERREALITHLALSGDLTQFSLPQRLPKLPQSPVSLSPLEQRLLDRKATDNSMSDRSPLAIRTLSEATRAFSAYQQAHAIARQYSQEILPVRKQISEENLLRYNGMIIGIFELLTDAKSQVESVEASLNANERFWKAQAIFTYQLALLKEHAALFRRDLWTQ